MDPSAALISQIQRAKRAWELLAVNASSLDELEVIFPPSDVETIADFAHDLPTDRTVEIIEKHLVKAVVDITAQLKEMDRSKQQVRIPFDELPSPPLSFAIDSFDTPSTQASHAEATCRVTRLRRVNSVDFVDYTLEQQEYSEPFALARYKIPQAIIDYFFRHAEYKTADPNS